MRLYLSIMKNWIRGRTDRTGTGAVNRWRAGRTVRHPAYMKLGKAYYEGGFEEPLPELLPLFDQITRLLKAREQAEESQFCPNCGQKVEKSSVFCGKCGQRLK